MTIEVGKKIDKHCVLNWLNEVYVTPSLTFNKYTDDKLKMFAHDALALLKENKKEMCEVQTATGLVNLEWAASTDYVFVELKISNKKTVIAPASVILSEHGGYDIHFIGNTINLSEESYGKTWRCWQVDEPHPIDREREPWK